MTFAGLKKCRPDDILRALGETGNTVHVQRRGIAGKDGARLHHFVEFFEYLFLDADIFEDRFDHQVGLGDVLV